MLTLPCCPCQNSFLYIHGGNCSFSEAEWKHTHTHTHRWGGGGRHPRRWQRSLNSHGSPCGSRSRAWPGRRRHSLGDGVIPTAGVKQSARLLFGYGTGSMTRWVSRHGTRTGTHGRNHTCTQPHMQAHLPLTPPANPASLGACLHGVGSHHGHWAVWCVTASQSGLFPFCFVFLGGEWVDGTASGSAVFRVSVQVEHM